MSLRPLSDVGAADWFLGSEVDWRVLVCLGPPGFEAYARVLSSDDDDVPNELSLAMVRSILAHHWDTSDDCFYGLWDGSGLEPPIAPAGPRFSVTTWIDSEQSQMSMRDYHLFAGSLDDYVEFARENNDPHLVWPADHTWFMAMDTDQSWLGVGGTQALIDELLATGIDAVPTTYGPEPLEYQ